MSQSDHKKVYVLDTNVFLHDPLCIYSFHEHDIIISMTVLEELDVLKNRNTDISRDARMAIRAIDNVLGEATAEQITKGVPIPTSNPQLQMGSLAIFSDQSLPQSNKIHYLNGTSQNDNRIINVALFLQHKHPQPVILISKDINMRLKAKGAGLTLVEDYRRDQVIEDVNLLTKGYTQFPGSFWDEIDNVETLSQNDKVYQRINQSPLNSPFPNQYIFDEHTDFAARVVENSERTVVLQDLGRDRLMNNQAWGIKPKNLYQAFALDALLDNSLELVMLTGAAGSGKTLLALASALELVLEKKQYDKILVTRSTHEISEPIGFLPGNESEKMTPWLGGILDSLEVLHKSDESPQASMDYIMDKANIQFKSLNFIRGRSIQDAIILLDEAQNLSASQLKTIITRCGQGTKLLCLGNLAQIDSNYLTPVTSGLTYIVERFKDFEGSAIVNINGVVRSRLASYAEENL